ncbi:hypothetical protein [Nocardia mangyaensis]|nr:hypothetical protein [Nocardia mangyaensis]
MGDLGDVGRFGEHGDVAFPREQRGEGDGEFTALVRDPAGQRGQAA